MQKAIVNVAVGPGGGYSSQVFEFANPFLPKVSKNMTLKKKVPSTDPLKVSILRVITRGMISLK